ncbi:hypothetical protein OGAPHI_006547 [Ogataea philodendri]|uniref:Small-subunit processome Utp21 domain-containing protein n=1 Tax=Ogataea philodendri TaxID=1378263 RepID=A0A9P8NY40_9ASCO|nr:uncharacterized protein OGAPHI_006547 [Ogataea philodendri]KAH3661697.1 hypothetical protein OGAPHI_006547 [Ogataea philodendri]
MTVEESVKRQKVGASGAATKVRKSKIFSPFRIIGHVSNGVPFAVGTLGQTFYIATVVGRSFQIYDAATLHLLFVSSNQTESPIRSITAHFHYIYCSYGNKIGIFRRGKLEKELVAPTADSINKVEIFGNYLVAVTNSSLFVFEKKDQKYATEYYGEIKVNSLNGEIVDIVHPPTYVNKVVVATTSHLLIFNVRSSKLVYSSEEFVDGITCVECAPALDILAVGNGVGSFSIYNLKKGKVLKSVNTGSNSKITSLSFRTDGSPHIASSMVNGDLFFYDLEKKARVHVLRNAHKQVCGGVSKVQFLNGQPILVTTGADNSLKEYVFDPALSSNSSVVSPPRHLRSRGGHSAPPSCISFADSKSHFLQSASQDRSFWTFSLRKDAQSQEMSQRQSAVKDNKRQAGISSGFKDKFPPITMIAQENAREGEWANIVTAHQDETFARTWDSRNKKVGKHTFDTIDGGIVKAVSITQCGNFALVGSSLGGIGVYNLQSGKIRKNYKLHKKTVTGVAVDGMNRKMVSCGLDGLVGFYDFSQSRYLGKLQLDAPITQMVYHRGSDLVAFALDDLSIVVVDTAAQKIVRQLFGHSNRITAMDFSPDGRWIVSASLDSTIRTWDLPTGGCIDGIMVPNTVTSLKMSPLGDYLATTHVNGVGISLWTNRSQFRPISTKHIEETEFATMMLPNVSGENGASVLDGAFVEEEEAATGTYVSVAQIDKELVTLSLQPRSKFNTIMHLDTIKMRNKPTEAPKKPEAAPFFLQQPAEESKTEESRLMKLDSAVSFESEFTKLLREGEDAGYDQFVDYLVAMSPANLDLELRTLQTTEPYTELKRFIKAISHGIKQNTNYELLVAIISVFMKIHADVLYNLEGEVADVLNEWDELASTTNNKMDDMTKYCSAVINFITTI